MKLPFLRCLLLSLFLAAPASAADLFEGLRAGVPNQLFRIDGSNTIGAELAPALVMSWMKQNGVVGVGISSGNQPNEVRLRGFHPESGTEVMVDIAAHGSSTGFKALAGGKTDIAAASRPVKDKESHPFPGVDLNSHDSEHIIGIDGLAIIVNPANPVSSLSVDQLLDIFSGRIRDWSEVGGFGGKISVLARDENSGTWDSFESMVLGDTPLRRDAERFESNNNLSDKVSKTPGAIGFVGLSAVLDAKLVAVSAGDVMSMYPGKLTVATEDYPLSRRLYMYTAGRPSNPFVSDFLDFVARGGQRLVDQVGFVSQDVQPVMPENYARLPETFRKMTQDARRLSVNFRFQQGSAHLDNKARRDLERLGEFVKQNPGADLMLFGFGDEGVSEVRTMLLSRHRAMAVARELRQQGIYPDLTEGLGADLPVSGVADFEGKLKNQRVEAWVRLPQQMADGE